MSERLPALPDNSPAVPEVGTPFPLSAAPPQWAQLGPESDKPTDWRRYISALYRHKWFIILSVVLGTALGVAGARVIQPEYTAEAAIWIETASRGEDRGPIQQGQLLESYAWVELLRSYVVLDYAVEGLKLYLSIHSEYDPRLVESFTLTGGQLAAGSYVLEVEPDGRLLNLRSAEGILGRDCCTGGHRRVEGRASPGFRHLRCSVPGARSASR